MSIGSYDNYNKNYLRKVKQSCALTVLDMHKRANSGHIGSSLSCLDILTFLYFYKMGPQDKLILSKGHAASSLYAILAKTGKIPKAQLNSYYQDGTILAAHPATSSGLKGVIFGTGSLGHGLSLATGLALSAKFSKKKFNVFCVLSDGDCNEGSTWEAALFASQHYLNNLTVIIDNNEIQAFGRTKEVLNLEPLGKKWNSFNFDTAVAKNGNDFDHLQIAFNKLDSTQSQKPKCIIAKTKMGHGVSFMKDKLEWHYLPMTDAQYKTAKLEIQNA